ncbi:MAG: AI-2E family transporter [Alkalilacustris sp.]
MPDDLLLRSTQLHDSPPAATLWRWRLVFWLLLVAAVGGLLWLLGPILMPFAVGAAMGYFLNPLVCRLERVGVPRAAGSAILVVSFMTLLLAGLVVLLPVLVAEAATLVQALPDHYRQAQRALSQAFPAAVPVVATDPVTDLVSRMGEAFPEAGGTVFGGILSGLSGLMRITLFWMIMPVVAFYLLLDWQRLVASVDALVPRANVHRVRTIGRDIDAALAGYVRGVTVVCLVLAVYYAAAFSLAGLNYGLLVGVVAGLISFVPYVGAFVGGALAIGLGAHQFWEAPLSLGVIVAIWALGQFFESQILVPRLVGGSVNLHPVWLIFAVMAFGSLFGLLGAIIAVPLAAVVGVLVRVAVDEYRTSRLYEGSASVG